VLELVGAVRVHEKAQGGLRDIIIQGGVIPAPALAVAVAVAVAVLAGTSALPIKVNGVRPASRFKLPKYQGLGGLGGGIQVESVTCRIVGPDECHTHARCARWLDPDLRRRRHSLAPPLLEVVAVEIYVAPSDGDPRAKVGNGFSQAFPGLDSKVPVFCCLGARHCNQQENRQHDPLKSHHVIEQFCSSFTPRYHFTVIVS